MIERASIIFEDQHLVVLQKPAGMLSQSDHSGQLSLVDALRTHFGRHYVGLIHRLDRNTSGIMIVAKRSKAAERLTAQLQDGRLKRSYLAWIEGALQDSGHSQSSENLGAETVSKIRWENWLLKNETTNEVKAYPPSTHKPHPNAKRAALHLSVLQHSERAGNPITLCRFELETGRSHQIRAQAAFHGHPLLGDRKYGSKIEFPRPALHSHRIEFEHPLSHVPMTYECPLPPDLLGCSPPL